MKPVFIAIICILFVGLLGAAIAYRKVPAADGTQLPPTLSADQQADQQNPSMQQDPSTSPDPSATTTIPQTTTIQGMTIQILKAGTGAQVGDGDTVDMTYTGTLADGTVFDSTDLHGGQPFSFTVGAGTVIKGWDLGIVGMQVGEVRKLVIPPELAYGANGIPGVIPPNATLTFTVQLVDFK